MEALAKGQVEIYNHLKEIEKNIDYLSEERKNLKIVSERIQKIQDLWKIYEENDDKIRTQHQSNLGHSYFTSDHYQKIASPLY
jgi:DNA repair ATPase RecN